MDKLILIAISCVFFWGCARSPIKNKDQAMRPAAQPKEIKDHLELKSLVLGIKENISQLKKTSRNTLKFGALEVSKAGYISAMEDLLKAFSGFQSKQDFYDYIRTHFSFHEVYGQKKWGEAFVTSYYDPVIKGSKYRTKKLTQPLYRTPKDMVRIDIGAYANTFPKWSVFADSVLEQKSRKSIVRGRRVVVRDGVDRIVPYYSRKEIDEKGELKGKGLEIVWVDPIESFFLQIQGSGVVRYKNGREIRVGYDSQNGHPYVPIGKYLLDVIPLEEMSLQKIEEHLRTLGPKEKQAILNKNPSYVFFRKIKTRSITYFGSPVNPGRTIATDYGYFPKGTLAYLEIDKPVFEGEKVVDWQSYSRFVIDQDTGGAIRGPHRVDLYWGKGEEAKKYAGVMKNWGSLYYLVPKKLEKK